MSTWDAELERSELSESFPTDFVGLDSGRVNSILRTIEEGILLWNTDGKLMYANPAALAHFNDSEGRSTGCHWAWLAQRCASAEGLPCDGECFPLDRVLAGDADARPVLLQVRCAEDKVRWLRVHTQPLTDTHGAVTGAVCSSVDVTRQVEQENSLKLQAHFDTLTGLPNRVLFSDRLDQALAHARRHRENLAVCMLDLDGFKIVNDSFGHSSGDQLLREVASRLHDSLRGDDTAARLGGDEFALLIGDLKTSGQCEQVVKRVLDAVGAPYFIDGAEVRVTASIGVTLFPGDTMDPDQLLRHADQAMYKAKQAGKNRFSIFDPILESRARANLGLVRKIEQALERHEFVLHYQPKVDCRAGRVVGLEALIRWNHPVLGQRMPGEFLPLIEREDMIVNIGDWVIDEALREQARLREAPQQRLERMESQGRRHAVRPVCVVDRVESPEHGHAMQAPVDERLQQVGRREQDDDAEHGHQGAIKPGRVTGGKPPVNHRSQSLTDAQHGHGSNHQGDGRKQYAIAVRLEQSQDNAGRSVLVGHGSVS